MVIHLQKIQKLNHCLVIKKLSCPVLLMTRICIEALKWGPGISSKKFICSFSSEKIALTIFLIKLKKQEKIKLIFKHPYAIH